jgi:hypothetical protein
MGKIKELTIDRFDSGVSNDPRDKDLSKFYHTKHFDTFTYPRKLVPRPAFDNSVTTGLSAQRIFKFIYDADDGGDYRLWGLGTRTSDNKTVIWKWLTDTTTWDAPSGNLWDTSAVMTDAFFNYKGYAYCFDTGNGYLQRYKLDESGGTEETYQDLSLTASSKVAQPVHCKQDDVAYFFANNKVYALNDTSWTGLVLTCPSNYYIANACEYGDYLAIVCNDLYQLRSVVFFWDRNASVTTFTRRFDFDTSHIYQIAVLDGRLIVVATDYVKVWTKMFNGAEFQVVKELVGTKLNADSLTNSMQRQYAVADNKLYFPMDFDIIGQGSDYNDRFGIWAVDSRGRIELAFMVDDATSYKGLFFLNGNLWVAYNTDGIAKSLITYSSAPDSVYESLFIGEGRQNKHLLSVGVQTEALPTAGVVTLKYRTSENSAWTTIFTHNTDGSYYHEAVNIESTGAILPYFKEMQFRVESEGGAVITGLNIKYEEIDDNPNG